MTEIKEQIKNYFENLPKQDASRTAGMTATYKFAVEGAGNWLVHVEDGKIRSEVAGDDATAECSIRVNTEDFSQILEGTLNTQMAFMSGQLIIEGDMGLAMKLGAVL